MNRPTLCTIARLLAPWRTIRQLEAENQRLRGVMDARARAEVLRARIRLHHCPVHGHQPLNAWGCPECVRELRQEDERLRSAMATAREAVRRLVRWNLEAYDSEVVRGVYIWATSNGMAGPLPPLPKRAVKREQLLRDPEAHC